MRTYGSFTMFTKQEAKMLVYFMQFLTCIAGNFVILCIPASSFVHEYQNIKLKLKPDLENQVKPNQSRYSLQLGSGSGWCQLLVGKSNFLPNEEGQMHSQREARFRQEE